MSIGARLRAILFVVGVFPVLVIGVLSYRASRDELTQVVQRSQQQTTEDLARFTETTVGHAVDALTLTTQALPLETFSRAELTDVLRIPFRQVGGLTAVALIDADGNAVVPPVFERDARREEPTLDQMATHVPLLLALTQGAAVGPPYRVASGAPRVVIAVRKGQWVVAGELSLLPVSSRIDALAQRGTQVVLLDAEGAPVWGARALSAPERALAAEGAGQAVTLEVPGAGPVLASFTQVAGLRWGVLTEQPRSVALGAATRVRNYTVYWAVIGLLLAGALSVYLARGITRPVAELQVAARALAHGKYETAPPTFAANDELGELATTFRQMAQEIRRRDEEINGWNRELQGRVDARSAELKQAQDQILRTQRLAALGSLGAGIAHELNNPLTGVLGLVGLVLSNLPKGSEDAQALRSVLEQSRKMTAIVDRFRKMADSEREDGGGIFQLGRPVRAAVARVKDRLEAQRIRLTCEEQPGVPDMKGNEAELEELVGQLLDNAICAMPEGGALDLAIAAIDGQALRLTVTDSGRGIPAEFHERIFDPFFTTKHDLGGTAIGLGLSRCHRIAEQHHGRLSVASAVGKGSAFTLVLPAAPAAPHLI